MCNNSITVLFGSNNVKGVS